MNFNPMMVMQNFANFRQNFMRQNPGVNPQQKVQELLNSGKMTQQQYENLRNIANKITGMNM